MKSDRLLRYIYIRCPLVPILSQMNPLYLLPFLLSSKWHIPFMFSDRFFLLIYNFSFADYTLRSSYNLVKILLIISGENAKLWNPSFWVFSTSFFYIIRLRYNILLSNLYSNTLRLCSPLIKQARFRINGKGKVIFLLIIPENRWEEKCSKVNSSETAPKSISSSFVNCLHS